MTDTALSPVIAARLPLRPLFTLTIFLGSFLLFLIQPMFARLALPQLGGTPAVWNVAMLFYQAVLLGGYVYAHLLTRLQPRAQLLVHVGFFLVAAVSLPISLGEIGDGSSLNPILWLLGLLAVSIGPVFFVVSSQAPLMQAWFARSDDPAAANPYFLYAASNAGSLLALLLYPLLIEPSLPLGEQTLIWSGGFVVLALLAALCGLSVSNAQPAAAAHEKAAPLTAKQILYWTALAAVPSGLMLSTTTHLTTDIIAVPLLWVIPLGLYLLSFIIAFSSYGSVFIHHARFLTAPLLLALGAYTFLATGVLALLMALTNLILLFYISLTLHGELAERKPPAAQLTAFYLCLSVGGMLGGLFCAIFAPLVFDWVYEHPILLVTAALLLPAAPLTARIGRLWRGKLRPFLLFGWPVLSLGASWWVHSKFIVEKQPEPTIPALVFIAAGAVLAIGQRIPFSVHFAALMLGLGGWQTLEISTIQGARERSFFGIYTVRADTGTMTRSLEHGTTLHGIQSLIETFETTPQSYYGPTSGIGQAMNALPALAGRFPKVGFVGLGIGSLSCYSQPGQGWTVFEIDPQIVEIARDESLFTFLEECGQDLEIVLGDARLSLAKEPPSSYDLLAVDAFSSDAIPQHLMTLEAFQLYERVLKDDGLLLVHISNRHIDLEPVLAAIAWEMDWAARVRDDTPPLGEGMGIDYSRSIWVALAPTEMRLQQMIAAGGGPQDGWRALRYRPGFEPWTDDFGSIIPVLRF